LLGQVLAACACGPSTPPVAAPDIATHMGYHFAAANDARDSVIRGDASRALSSLSWLATHHEDAKAAPPSWKPYLEQLQQAALAARDADSLGDAARGVAALAAACGACHSAHSAGPRLAPHNTAQADAGGKPAYAFDLDPTMHQHAWAAQRLWEGLIAPSEAAFSEGMAALRDLDVNREPADNLRTHLARIRALGAPTTEPRDPDWRAVLYAHAITECGGCHQAFAVDPGPLK
jgi:cytochrome c553